jgi:hypothetical protein
MQKKMEKVKKQVAQHDPVKRILRRIHQDKGYRPFHKEICAIILQYSLEKDDL